MHNKKREKHLGGRCVQRPPEVIPLGVQAERQQHGTRLHKTRQNNDHNRDHEGHIQQNATCYPQGAVAGQKARDEVGVLDAVNEQDEPHAEPEPLVRSHTRQRGQRHHDVQGQRQNIHNEHPHDRPTFRIMPTSATTRATGMRIHRFRLASDAWW